MRETGTGSVPPPPARTQGRSLVPALASVPATVWDTVTVSVPITDTVSAPASVRARVRGPNPGPLP